jgi:hypothetical protein
MPQPPAQPDAVITITGIGGTPGNDQILLRLDPNDPQQLQVFINTPAQDEPSHTVPLAAWPSLTIDTAAGDNVLTIDFGHGNPIPSGGLNLIGGEGVDRLTILLPAVSGELSMSLEQIRIGDSMISLAGIELPAVHLQASARLDSLSISAGRVELMPGGNRVLRTSSLAITGEGQLDLFDNDLILECEGDAAPEALLAALMDSIRSARNNGAWTGPGLTSSSAANNELTTLAVMLNTGPNAKTTFSGQDVNSNCLLVKYTWNGDMNLDGKVDADDYFQIDSGFLRQSPVNYQNGDLNYDKKIDADDYFLIDKAFLAQSGTLATTSSAQNKTATETKRSQPKRRMVRTHRKLMSRRG